MKILIMRHGEAESLSRAGGIDAERNLTDFGRRQAQQAGRCIEQSGFVPDAVWVSPYRRAQQTATGFLESFAGIASETLTALVPDAAPAQLLDSLAQRSPVDSGIDNLMLVSHQPLVSFLVAGLSGLQPYAVPGMNPASMVMLECDQPLPGCCNILWQRHSPEFTVSH